MQNNKIQNIAFAFILSLLLIGCDSSPYSDFQGIYEVDKKDLKAKLSKESDASNALGVALIEKVIDNAVIELKVEKDSIYGLLFLAGNQQLINTTIEKVVGDSAYFNEGKSVLTRSEKGLHLNLLESDYNLTMVKQNRDSLSNQTKKALNILAQRKKEKEEFEESLGQWEINNFVDEFGDEAGGEYVSTLVRGTSSNSYSSGQEVLAKIWIASTRINIEIYNEGLSRKERMPDNEFGVIKYKMPDGEVKTERVFFYENSASVKIEESDLFKFLNSGQEGMVKVLIDTSTGNKYMSDEYQFSLKTSNFQSVYESI